MDNDLELILVRYITLRTTHFCFVKLYGNVLSLFYSDEQFEEFKRYGTIPFSQDNNHPLLGFEPPTLGVTS